MLQNLRNMMPSTKSGSMTDISTLSSVIKNVTHITTSTEEDSQYLFKTLNGYQVTAGTFIFNLSVITLGIWIIVLNCLLIQTLVKYRAYLEVTDIFIHNLAATDATTGLLLIYNSTYNILNFQNRYECLIRFGLIQSMSLCSNGFIAMLTINRYIMVSRPFSYRKIFKKKFMVTSSVFTWCLSLAVGFMPLVGWNQELAPQQEDNGSLTVCRFFGVMDPGYVWLNVGLYWLPVFLMLVLYTHMSKIACNHAKAIKANERAITNKEEKAFDRHSWKLTKTVSIVIGVYLFCWMPTGLYLMLQLSGSIYEYSLTQKGEILMYVSSVGFLNSLMNPLIYATKISVVKRRFKRIFCCSKERRQSLHRLSLSTLTISSIFKSRSSLSLHRPSQGSIHSQTPSPEVETKPIS